METIRFGKIGLEDLATGRSQFEATLADGQIVTLNEINNLNLAQQADGADSPFLVCSNNFQHSAAYSSVADAITTIGSSTRTLIIPQSATIDADLTIPANVTLVFWGTGQLSVNSGVTCTINGPIQAPPRQIFAGSGTVAFTSNYSLKEVYPQWWGATGDGATDDTAAIIAANTAAAGQALRFPAGTYKWAGDITPGNTTPGSKTIWQGEGWQTKFQAADSTSRILVTNSCSLKDFWVIGSVSVAGSYVGTAIQIGNTDFCGQVELENVRVRYFEQGVRFAAALWTTLTKCNVDYCQYGYNFNAGAVGLYSTTVAFYDCVASNCDRNGVAATYVPINNVNINWFGGNIEECGLIAPATYPMFQLSQLAGGGGARPCIVDGCYFEYTTAGTKPNFINSNGMSQGRISNNYFNSPTYGIYDASGGTTDMSIYGNYFVSTVTADINIASGTRNNAWSNELAQSASCVLSGTGCKLNKFAMANLDVEGTTFTSTIVGLSTAGTNTYVWQSGYYTKIGNIVYINGAVRLSAKDAGMAGDIVVGLGSLPTSWNQTVNYSPIHIIVDNTTLGAGYSTFKGQIETNENQIRIYKENNAAGAKAAVVAGDISNTTIIAFSGHYMVQPGT